MTTNLLGLDAPGMERFFAGIGEKPFRARQVLKWVHRRGAADFAAMTDIAKELREKLGGTASIEPPAVVGDSTSPAGVTYVEPFDVDLDEPAPSVPTLRLPFRPR